MKKYAKRVALALTMMTAVSLGAYAQSETERVVVNPKIDYTVKKVYLLGGINVDKVPGYEQDILTSIAGVTSGDVVTMPDDATAILNRYWKNGLFSNVSISADSIVENAIYLHIHLTPRPRISAINWHGVKKSEREDLEAKLGLVAGNQITPDMADRAERVIKRFFEEKGFKNVEANLVQRDDVGGENKVLVDINIDKKEKIKVRKIHIAGVDDPKHVKKLKRAMKGTKENTLINFFSSKKFRPEKYNEDKDKLIEKMNEWGYRDALLLKDSVAAVDDSHVDVYVDLYEGPKYYIRKIDWVGNTVFSTEALNRALMMKSGDVYDQTKLNKRLREDEDAAGSQYYNTGYVFSQILPVELNVENDSIDLELRVTEGQPATLKNVRITGNDRTYEHVVRRELRTKPGDLFSKESFMRSMREIASMQLFDPEKIDYDIKPDENSGTVDITYKLTSKSSDAFELSAGWGQTGVVGKVGIKFTNFSMGDLFGKAARRRAGFLPQGEGQTLSISAQTNGTYYQSYNISFLDPWFGGKRPNQFQVSAFYSKQSDVNSSYYNNYYNYSLYNPYGSSSTYNYSNYYDPDKYIKMYGLSIGFGTRLRWPDDYFTLLGQLSYTRYTMRNWPYFLIANGSSNNINLNFTLSRNSTDNAFFPRRGSEFTFSVSATPPYSLWNGKDYKNLATDLNSATYTQEQQDKYRWVEYHKWKFKFRSFTALTSKAKTPVLMTRFEGGLLGHYNKYNKSPFETFYVGGDGMSGYSTGYATETIGLRGYDNGSLTPSYYEAYAYTRMSLELRYPLLLEGQTQIFALAFAEGGNAWTSTNKFNPFDMKRSVGLGVRLFLPMVGLMGIDWAYGFDKVFGVKTYGGSHFHFVIGQEF